MISKNVVFNPINRETITEPVSDEIFHWQGYPVFLKDRLLSGVRKDTQYKVHHHKDLIARSLLKMSIVFHRYSGKSKVEEPFCTDFYADIGILPLF